MAIDANTLAEIVVGVAAAMEKAASELGALDAAIGDGDLGLTFTLGARAVRRVVAEFDRVEPATLLVASGRAFANANPSTMGALVGAALTAAGGAVRGRIELGPTDLRNMGTAAYKAISTLGHAELGQKTVLDALGPSIEVLSDETLQRSEPLAVLSAMRAAAEEGAAAMDPMESQIGRASWLGARSRGKRDPGAESWVMILRAIERLLAGDVPGPATHHS